MNPGAHYILSKPEPFKSILLQLQLLVEHTVPEAELLYKWHLPFYYLNGKMFC
ncbi:MAG TPA: 2-dehydro-3-deoxyphosphooctonate aldolase, partial [Leeuwenhoekiella sp.]|nr:2-dehydro-3-deoxyphosphooctonate aldolase [Leeuwenhoekiella sp.]